MKVQIRRIGLEGMDLQQSFPAEFIGLTKEDAVKFVAPFQIKATATRVEDEVVIAFAVQSRYACVCGRCLETVEQDWAAQFTLTYNTKEFREFVELDEDIRQELLLNLPVRILCQADCKGLCVDCGVNLNKEQCGHNHTVINGQ